MKKILLAASCLLSIAYGQGSLVTGSDTKLITTQETKLVLDNLHFQHNSLLPQINGVLRFTGNLTTQFSGSQPQQVFALEVDKPGSELQLQQDVAIENQVRFFNGKLNLKQAVVQLSPTAKLLNETEVSRAYTTGDGYLTITVNMNAPSLVNAGNLGVFVSSAANLGATTVKRGHKPQLGTGLSSSITRYFDLVPTNNSNLNATVELLYFDAELNALNEGTLSLFQSNNSGTSWTPLNFDQKSTTENYLRKGALASLHRYTLSAAVGAPLPVMGLEFTARRLNHEVVQLDWQTVQEIDNKGFYVERKKENESAFSTIHFAPSKGLNGNSNTPLNYLHIDPNTFTGKTWYRLRQVDLDGNATYSMIRVVDGDASKPVTIKAWPIPAPSEFSVAVTGITNDVLLLYDGGGRLVRQINLVNDQVVKIAGLQAGTYLLKLKAKSEVVQKIIVQ